MFDFMVNGPQENGVVAPPKDQTEYQNRVGMWQQFQEKVKTDPAFRFALMQGAVQMLQPIQPGQSTLGHVGQAFGHGAQAYALANQSMSEQDRAQQELDMKQRESGARVENTQAQTNMTREQTKNVPLEGKRIQADTRRAEALAKYEERGLTDKLKKLQADATLAANQGTYYAALGSRAQIEADITKQYGGREAEAKIARDQAAAAASAASAAHANALVKKVASEAEMQKGWRPSGQNVDKETGIVTITATNSNTGEQRIVRSVPPMQMADAVQRAKMEVKSIDANTPGQVFGESKERLSAYERLVGEKVSNQADAVRKLAERYRVGGATMTTIGRDGTVKTVKVEDDVPATSTPTPTTTQPAATPQPAVNIPADVQQTIRQTLGTTGVATSADGSRWRLDGRGGATPLQAQPPATQQTAPPSSSTSPMFKDKANMANDPTIRGLDTAIQQAAAQQDSAKVQELTALRQKHIQENYMP